jgi:hypothetical protein
MENFFAFNWLDLRPDPVNPLPWATLLGLLAVVFVLAVAFTAGLVWLLIRMKRRRTSST